MEVLHHGGPSVVVFAESSSVGVPIDGVEDEVVPGVPFDEVAA